MKRTLLSVLLLAVCMLFCCHGVFAEDNADMSLEKAMQQATAWVVDKENNSITFISPQETNDVNINVHEKFADVPWDAWYHRALSHLTQLGIVQGVSEDEFAPQGSVSRAEFAAMLALIEGVDLAAYRGVSSFDDVAATATINAYRYLNNHYYDAYTYYLNGNKYIGYKEIGMSIHYLEDLNTPYHAANLTTGNSRHAAYETWAKDVAANHTTTMTYAAYRYVYDSTFIGMSNNFAGLAKGSLSVCNRFDHGNADVVAQARAATRTNLGRTERAVCGLLNRFYYNSQM